MSALPEPLSPNFHTQHSIIFVGDSSDWESALLTSLIPSIQSGVASNKPKTLHGTPYKGTLYLSALGLFDPKLRKEITKAMVNTLQEGGKFKVASSTIWFPPNII